MAKRTAPPSNEEKLAELNAMKEALARKQGEAAARNNNDNGKGEWTYVFPTLERRWPQHTFARG